MEKLLVTHDPRAKRSEDLARRHPTSPNSQKLNQVDRTSQRLETSPTSGRNDNHKPLEPLSVTGDIASQAPLRGSAAGRLQLLLLDLFLFSGTLGDKLALKDLIVGLLVNGGLMAVNGGLMVVQGS